MKIGITGTREGLAPKQVVSLFSTMIEMASTFDGVELHHGDCVGADATAHDLAISLGLKVVIYPPAKDTARAFKVGIETRAPAPYLARNRALVDEVYVLIVLPKQESRPTADVRGGTWYTYRYAVKRRSCATVIIWPNGHVEAEAP